MATLNDVLERNPKTLLWREEETASKWKVRGLGARCSMPSGEVWELRDTEKASP